MCIMSTPAERLRRAREAAGYATAAEGAARSGVKYYTYVQHENGTRGIPVDRAEVEDLLRPGTRRTYDTFARCTVCGRPYWKGAHHRRLEAVVASAYEAVGRAGEEREG